MIELALIPAATTVDGLIQHTDELIPIVAIVMGCSIAIIAIISGTIQKSVQTKQYEESRREIAAYIAEGSMTPADGERLLKSSPKHLSKNA